MALDLDAIRKRNQARLLGTDSKEGKGVVPYTASDIATSNDVCWDIISLIVRKESVKTQGKDGKEYTKQTKNRKFPELLTETVVGERATSKTAKADKVLRTNLATMEEMYQMRNKMIRFYQDDTDDSYIAFFKNVIETLNGYAQTVITDICASDADFLDKVNKARGC